MNSLLTKNDVGETITDFRAEVVNRKITMTTANEVLHVFAAAIFNKQGDLLIAQRPLDKHMGGVWEFPGGKVETGDAVTNAIYRELDEELGIQLLSLESLICIEHAYPEKTVLLDVWIVRDFGGEAYVRERHAVQWVAPYRLDQFEFPEAIHAIIEALNI